MTIIEHITENKQDAILWQSGKWLEAAEDPYAKAKAVESIGKLIFSIESELIRANYCETIATYPKFRQFKLKKAAINTAILQQLPTKEKLELPEPNRLPPWMNLEELDLKGFCTVEDKEGHRGYWTIEKSGKYRITNFTITPVFHVEGKGKDSRHIIEINNGRKKAIVDVQSNALLSVEQLGTEIVAEGNFIFFGTSIHIKRIASELLPHFHRCSEIKQPGWQRKGFFVYLDKVIVPGQKEAIIPDKYGVFPIGEKHYLIPASSEVYSNRDYDSDPYELQRALTSQKPKVSFSEWATLFCKTYTRGKGLVGISFAILCIFRDVVFAVNGNVPHLYGYGEKSSGKSQMAESLTYLFFKVKRTFALNAGTDFGFFSFMGAFRNCINHMNELDEKSLNDKWFQALKAAYDGEGRTRGVMGGQKNQIEVQHVDSPLVLTGQYLATKDDNSLVSRSLILPFSVIEHTDESFAALNTLKELQADGGLNGMLEELIHLRPLMEKTYYDEYTTLLASWRKGIGSKHYNQRMYQNWCHLSTLYKIVSKNIALPENWTTFDIYCQERADFYSQLMQSSDTLTAYWNIIAELNDNKV
ncbi:MAG: hypothetical protein ABI169_16180, partial [Chitinophagaceae bacterium]